MCAVGYCWLGILQRICNQKVGSDWIKSFVADGCKGCSWIWIAKCFGKIESSFVGSIGRWECWHFAFCEEEFKHVNNAFSLSGQDVDLVALVVFKGWSDVPSVDAMCCPACLLATFLVCNNACTGWCKRCTIVVEGSLSLCICREFWIEAELSHEVQCDFCLFDNLVP